MARKNRYSRALQLAKDIMKSGVDFKHSHTVFVHNMSTKLYQTDDWKKLTVAERAYIMGWIECRFEMHWSMVEWGLLYEGKVTKFEKLPLEIRSRVITGEEEMQHFWNGTTKPYTLTNVQRRELLMELDKNKLTETI